MLTPKTHAELRALVDGRIQESQTLEYKRIRALDDPDEICRDVSAMANSAGGTIIYGIKEDKQHNPEEVDVGDADPKRREWIENILTSRVSPKMEGVKILPIELDSGGYAFVVTVPQGVSRAPHQAPDNKYYKRHNFKREAMADYEVRDTLRRAETPNVSGTLRFPPKLGPRSVREGPFPIIVYARNASDAPVLYAVTRLTCDSRLVFHHPEGFQPAIDHGHVGDSATTSFEHLTVVPNSPPIFRGHDMRIGGSVRVSITAPYVDNRYPLALHITCPGNRFSGAGEIEVKDEQIFLNFPDLE